MRRTHGEGVLVIALVAAFTGCADPVSRVVAPLPSSAIAADPTSPQPSEERIALTKIARLVALSMDNEPARQHL
ncbi:MAG TPA: hypothetical protein VF887_06630, partial [Gemmatimonadaceae bacterium]